MKVKDYGSNATITKEKSDTSFSPANLDMNLDIINKNILNGCHLSKNFQENEKIQKPNQIKDKENLLYENNDLLGNKL